MFATKIREEAETAPRHKLPEINKLLWSAFAAGSVTEAEAEALSGLIAARQGSKDQGIAGPAPAPRRVGSRPRTDASMERRRRWAASGRLPPALAARFTQAEVAVLAVVTLEVSKRGDCRLALDHIAALAGVSRSTVRNAMKQARTLGFITVTERRASAWRNLPNVVSIVSREWISWMRLARRDALPGGGRKSVSGTNTSDLRDSRQRAPESQQKAADKRLALPSRQNREAQPRLAGSSTIRQRR